MLPGYTQSAERAIKIAIKWAKKMGGMAAGTEHLLIGLAECDGTSADILKNAGLDRDKLLALVEDVFESKSELVTVDKGAMTPRADYVVKNALKEALFLGMKVAGTEHLLLAMIKQSDCIGVRVLNTLGVNVQKVFVDTLIVMNVDINTAKEEFVRLRNKVISGNESTTPMLEQYSMDLTKIAKDGKIDPVIGREKEIQSLIRILSRRTKNNPCLIGEPGVGKTAVAEALAQKIADGDVPNSLQGVRLMSLDMSGMVAGTKYRGEFEERIKKVIAEAESNEKIVLFIDELHSIIGAGNSDGTLDASNILKPALSRGELRIIGATTIDEYRKYIEKDAALERRFQSVMVEEPSEADCIKIISGLRKKYEEHHGVVITDAAVNAAVRLTNRYVNDRFLPDKAVDAMDEAAAKLKLNAIISMPDIKKHEEEYKELDELKEQALKEGNIEEASDINAKQEKLKGKIARLKKKQKKLIDKEGLLDVGEDEIADIVSEWTKIPVKRLHETETEKLINLEDTLKKRVIGQDEAVKAVARAVRRGRVGLQNPMRPIGSFLFLGPTGVGKTELSKALAEAVFGKETNIIRVDMSEYMEKESVAKIIGAPPGYVGYDEGGQLCEKVRRNPYSVVLFDEIEKAHPDVFNVLLQVLEDGHVTDSKGRRVSFKETIIIMTSNAGAQRIMSPKHLGFGSVSDDELDYKKMHEGVMEEVKRIFKPEFINRIDDIIVFRSLTKEDIKVIVGIIFNQLAKRALDYMHISLKATDALISHIADKGFDKNYGARPVRRAIQTEIEDGLADKILGGEIGINSEVLADWNGKEVTFSVR